MEKINENIDKNIWKLLGNRKICNQNNFSKEIYYMEKKDFIKKNVLNINKNKLIISDLQNISIGYSVYNENKLLLGIIKYINNNEIELNNQINNEIKEIYIENINTVYSALIDNKYIPVLPFEQNLKYFYIDSKKKNEIHNKNNSGIENIIKNNNSGLENTVISIITLGIGFIVGNYVFNKYLKVD